ncbi:MAG TPA: Fur family transcriptional regulator [Patescibacteria group bacterium]|nr:Fur family transcriptional regulator [Patescibacteria group bacterium]
MEDYIGILRRNGYKMTLQRRAVLDALQKSAPFASAQTILEYVRRTVPDVSLDTIYRNLNLLTELELVLEVQTRTREGVVYELAISGHHHHLVCLECGKTRCLDFCPIDKDDISRAEGGGDGFKVITHSLDFYGYCSGCRPEA